ncbi:MAG: hypothetical protein IJL06_03925 [Kiritimatiellae bacterium]|nr:hypothetical protein [Kiritimatiellia bacterium]
MDPTDIVLHLIARITDAISFPVGNAEFDAVLDDCIAALEGSPSPAEDRARAERSLRALLDQTSKLGLAVPDSLREEAERFLGNPENSKESVDIFESR